MSESASVILMSVFLAVGCILLVSLVRRAVAGLPMDSHQASSRPWGLADVLATFVLLSASQILAALLLKSHYSIEEGAILAELDPAIQSVMILASAVATTVAFAAAIVWFGFRYGSPLRAMGLDPAFLVTDLLLGAKAFLLVAPVVYSIQFLLAQWIEETHPIIELLQKNPDPQLFIFSGMTAILVAPVTEEYLFRFLLLGWLDRVASRGKVDEYSLWGGVEPVSASTEHASLEHAQQTRPEEPALSQGPVWPIACSAGLFALAHYSHGPAPVPLFVFALVLGYLYRRTGRILPCIVLHLLLNSCSLLLFALYLLAENG